MRIALILSLILAFGCTQHIKLSRIIHDNYSDYNIFLCKNRGTNKFYGAINTQQVKMLLTSLRIKIWKGYWDGMEEDGIIITRNNSLYEQVFSNIIIKSNIYRFKDSLETYTKNNRICDKPNLIQLIDSLKKTSNPFYVDTDTISFYGNQFFKINYNIGNNKFPSKKEHSTISLTNDSILKNFQLFFPDRNVLIANFKNSRDGNIELNIRVAANNKYELSKFDTTIYSKIKSVKQVTRENFFPQEYRVYFFTKDK